MSLLCLSLFHSQTIKRNKIRKTTTFSSIIRFWLCRRYCVFVVILMIYFCFDRFDKKIKNSFLSACAFCINIYNNFRMLFCNHQRSLRDGKSFCNKYTTFTSEINKNKSFAYNKQIYVKYKLSEEKEELKYRQMKSQMTKWMYN